MTGAARRGAVSPSEHEEQSLLITLAQMKWPRLADLLFAIPNGGARHIRTALRLKAEGVRAGVPDLFFAVPSGGYHGLFIEMKRRTGGRLSKDQREFMRALIAEGYRAEVCRGCDEALAVMEDYLRGGASGVDGEEYL